jgi:hypothetical protein
MGIANQDDKSVASIAATRFTVAIPGALNSIGKMLGPEDTPEHPNPLQRYYHHRLALDNGAGNVTDFNGFMQQMSADTQDKNPLTAKAAQAVQGKIGVARGYATQPLPDDTQDTQDTGGDR